FHRRTRKRPFLPPQIGYAESPARDVGTDDQFECTARRMYHGKVAGSASCDAFKVALYELGVRPHCGSGPGSGPGSRPSSPTGRRSVCVSAFGSTTSSVCRRLLKTSSPMAIRPSSTSPPPAIRVSEVHDAADVRPTAFALVGGAAMGAGTAEVRSGGTRAWAL